MNDEELLARQREDEKIDQLLGTLLRWGVLFAAFVAFAGGVLFLSQHGGEAAGHGVFRGEPAELRSVRAIVAGAFHANSASLIQLGLLCLIATPIARVVMSLFAFVRQRDWTYVVVTGIVLTVLGYSLLAGH